MDINKVILIGNVVQDPNVRDINGTEICNFSLATSERWTNKNTGEKESSTTFHNITAWRGLAKVAEKVIRKGRKVYIEGKIENKKLEKPDGTTKFISEVYAFNLIALDSQIPKQSSPEEVDFNDPVF